MKYSHDDEDEEVAGQQRMDIYVNKKVISILKKTRNLKKGNFSQGTIPYQFRQLKG